LAWSRLPVAVVLAALLGYSPDRMLPNKAAIGDALEALILEHEYCGELDSAVEPDRVWMTWTCGAVINRALEPIA
jgi:hypothetical protein